MMKFMVNYNVHTAHTGCMKCIHYEYSHALRDVPGTVCVLVPAATCAPCDQAGRNFFTRMADWWESAWASCCLVGNQCEMVEVVLCKTALTKMVDYLMNVAIENSTQPLPTMIFRAKEAMDSYYRLAGSNPHADLYGLEWHLRVAYTRVTNPRKFIIVSSTVPRSIEDVPVTVTPQDDAVDPCKSGGQPLFGYTLDPSTWRDLPLSEEVLEIVKDNDEIHPGDEKRLAALRSEMELYLATEPGGLGSRDSLIAEGKIKPQGMFLLPGRKENPVYAAAPTLDNLRAALRLRHFPKRERPQVEALAKLKACEEVFLDYIKKSGKEETIMRKNHEIFAQYMWDPRYTASKSWSVARVERAIHDMVYKTQPRIALTKKGLVRKVHVKPNEVLPKRKPRLIISSGDEGTFLQNHLPGMLEQLVFSLPRFKMMSVKSASPADFVYRMKAAFNEHKDWYAMSCDYGAFDSCVTKAIRERVEQPILDWLVDMFETIYTRAAQIDRNDPERRVVHPQLRLLIRDMIRESGDRGTSILNFVTNWVIFLYACYRHAEDHGIASEPQIKSILAGILDRHSQIVSRSAGTPLVSADLAGEGDDSHQWFSPAFINGAFDGRSTPGINDGTLKAFTERWIGYVKEVGFNLEPQNAVGRCTDGALQPAFGRHEFVSKLLIPYKHGDKIAVAVVPKVRKFMDSMCISFQKGRDWRNVLAEKALSLMTGAVDSPLLFNMAATVYRNARSWTGSRLTLMQSEYETMRAHLGEYKYTSFVQALVGLENVDFDNPCPDAYDRLCTKHYGFMMDGENAPKHKAVYERIVDELVGVLPSDPSYAALAAVKGRHVRAWTGYFQARLVIGEASFMQEWQQMRSDL